jgi:hypothetical protein
MGKVFFEDPIHHLSGKIAKKFRTIYNYMKATGAKTMRAYLWRVCGQGVRRRAPGD